MEADIVVLFWSQMSWFSKGCVCCSDIARTQVNISSSVVFFESLCCKYNGEFILLITRFCIMLILLRAKVFGLVSDLYCKYCMFGDLILAYMSVRALLLWDLVQELYELIICMRIFLFLCMYKCIKKMLLKRRKWKERYNSCSVIETTSTSIYKSPGLVFNFCCLLFTGMAPQFYDIFSDFDHICYPNHTLKDTFYLVFCLFCFRFLLLPSQRNI